MIAVDANVLLRFLIGDDPVQSPKSVELVERAVQEQQRIFVADVVLCEIAWVLRWVYRAPKRDIVATFRRLLATRSFHVRSRMAVERALQSYGAGRGDFADYLIGEAAAAAGAHTIYTFDKALRDEAGFSLLT